MKALTPHIIFIGIACLQVVFMLTQWFIYKRNEYLLYIAYVLSIVLFVLCRVNEAFTPPSFAMPDWLSKLSYQPLGIFSYWMYLKFARSFLSLKRTQPKVFKYTKWLEWLFVFFILMVLALNFFNIPKGFFAIIYFTFYIAMLLLSIPMFVLMLMQKNLLNNFLVFGCLCYVLGGFVGTFVNSTTNSLQNKNLYVFLCIEVGIVLELLLLNTGFMLKNRILQQQALKGQQKIMQQHFPKQKPNNF